MQVAVASGKGGTGKTTVAVNLARLAAGNGERVAYLDCDVEEPNGHIFLGPEISETRPVFVAVPEVDRSVCRNCGSCGKICRFSAITALGPIVLTFPELCHSCGGCVLVCPSGAIREVPRETGTLERGQAGGVEFVHGILKVKEAKSPPLIRKVRREAPADGLVIIDAPPGTSCPVVASVRGTDFVVLVTEPTPFGLNDLELSVAMVRQLGIPFGVVINRAGSGDGRTQEYCRDNGIEVLAEIPDDRRAAEACSRGELLVGNVPGFDRYFESLLEKINTFSAAGA